jgi:DNA-binding CsgD family transcriptional regulator
MAVSPTRYYPAHVDAEARGVTIESVPPQSRSSGVVEAIEAASDLVELGSQLAQIGNRMLGASGVCFFPFPGNVSSTADATFFHEQHSTEHMRAQTLAFIPVQEHEFAQGKMSALDRFFQSKSRVVDLNALLGPEGLERKPSFNEYWRPCHIERQLFAPLGLRSAPLGYLVVSRSVREATFRDADRQRLEWLSQHALRALHRLSPGARSPSDVLDALRGIPLPCAVFSSRGTLLWLSSEACSQLEVRWLGTSFADVVEHNGALAEWQAAARDSQSGSAPSTQHDGLTVQQLSTRSGPLVLVIGARGAHGPRPALARLRQLWQLTARESEVLGELAAGCSNKEIAARLDCSARTVDVHVSSLLRKAQCASRAELIARVLSTR